MLKALGGTLAVLYGCASVFTILTNLDKLGFSTPYQTGYTVGAFLGVLMFPLGFYLLLKEPKKPQK